MADQNTNEGLTGPIPERNFSEKSFYLDEFRRRTLAIVADAKELRALAPLESVLKDLARNETRVVLISGCADSLRALTGSEPIEAHANRLEGRVWRSLRKTPSVGIMVREGEAFPAACRDIVLRLSISKLLWIDPAGPLLRPDGRRLSFVDLGELREMLGPGPPEAAAARRDLLHEIEAALGAGIPAVNLCTLEGIAEELFSYDGSGTLFTRKRYVETRRLGIDDYDAAFDLFTRGVAEGYLAPRSRQSIDQILASGYGAFVEGRHLAGIGALLPWSGAGVQRQTGEIASLYTLTRFVGEGVGGHLVKFAVESARDRGCSRVFACTTSARVVEFFERNHFRRIDQREIPAEKWRDYDAARREIVQCLALDLD